MEMQFGNSVAPNEGAAPPRDPRQVQFYAIMKEALGKVRAVRLVAGREVQYSKIIQEAARKVQAVMQEPAPAGQVQLQQQGSCKRKAIETSLAVESSKRAKEVSVVDGMMLSVMFSLCCEQGNVVRRKLHGIPTNFTFNQLKEYVENIFQLQPNSHVLEWIHDTENQWIELTTPLEWDMCLAMSNRKPQYLQLRARPLPQYLQLAQKRRADEIGEGEIRGAFGMSLMAAANTLNTTVSTLSKRAKSLGICTWEGHNNSKERIMYPEEISKPPIQVFVDLKGEEGVPIATTRIQAPRHFPFDELKRKFQTNLEMTSTIKNFYWNNGNRVITCSNDCEWDAAILWLDTKNKYTLEGYINLNGL